MAIRVRSSLVCVYKNSVLVFKGVDPHSGRQYWFLPGGKIENGEEPWACAQREALEETGYRIKAARESELICHYAHEWNANVHQCKTYFYRGVLAQDFREPLPVDDATYNKGPAWLPLTEIKSAFGYCPEILGAVTKLVQP